MDFKLRKAEEKYYNRVPLEDEAPFFMAVELKKDVLKKCTGLCNI